MKLAEDIKRIGVVGSGAMGTGISQEIALAGLQVCLVDESEKALNNARDYHQKSLFKLVEKNRLDQQEAEQVLSRIHYSTEIQILNSADMVIEAIVENEGSKKLLFNSLEQIVSSDCILASNTSSLSITALASACKNPKRMIGLHFFNPVNRMALVEIVPALQSEYNLPQTLESWIHQLGKVPVICQDTPGFLVNRIARPFYGEALQIWEEGLASMNMIDQTLKNLGGFKMGPFELMDFIGNDINYAVTESVYQAFYQNPKYKPSFVQKRLFLAKHMGRKSGIGFRDYTNPDEPFVQIGLQVHDSLNKRNGEYESNAQMILNRVLFRLINEAADTLYYRIATREAIDLAMLKGANYPQGLLKWADQIGLEKIIETLDNLEFLYKNGKYVVSPLLRKMSLEGRKFY